MLAAAPLMMGGIQAAMGVAQGLGNYKPDRPTYQMPQEVLDAQQIMEDRTRIGLPGKDIMTGNMESSFAGNLSGIKDVASGGSLIGAVSNAYGGLVRGVRDIELMDSQFKDNAKLGLANQMMTTAQFRDKEFQYNQDEPYQMSYNEYINNKNASAQNFFGGLSNMGKTWMAHENSQGMQAMLDKVFGKTPSGDTPADENLPMYAGYNSYPTQNKPYN